MAMISVNNLTRKFGDIVAVNNLNFEINKGELFGFIGPDGAGKTTLFRILATLLIPDEGDARVMNLDTVSDYKKLRKHLGYMPGRFSLYSDLSVEENLNFFASIFGSSIEENYDTIKDIYEAIEPFKKRRAGKLSGGMKQKLALSCALIHSPEVLLLDEPTTGVDAVSRREFWDTLNRLKSQGLTIVVSTPYMDEAKRCDRVALMQKGSIMGIDTPENVTKMKNKTVFGVRGEPRYEVIKTLRKYPHAESVYAFGEYLHYTDEREDVDIQEIRMYLLDHGFNGVEVKAISPTIEDAFMALMEKHDE
ncbi:MAG TPA: ABC transporter ATP-binding protein [Balneolales bacterium]|nr:ABC transporter ATP-binding protein [Balneolales bacterium]